MGLAGRREPTNQWESIDFSEQPNDVIQVSFSLALPGSSSPDRLGSGRGGWRQRDWLGVSVVQMGDKGCDKGDCSGNGKQGCGMDGLEKDVKWRSGYWLLNNSLRTIRYLQIIAYIAGHSLCVRPCVRRGLHAFSHMKRSEIPR